MLSRRFFLCTPAIIPASRLMQGLRPDHTWGQGGLLTHAQIAREMDRLLAGMPIAKEPPGYNGSLVEQCNVQQCGVDLRWHMQDRKLSLQELSRLKLQPAAKILQGRPGLLLPPPAEIAWLNHPPSSEKSAEGWRGSVVGKRARVTSDYNIASDDIVMRLDIMQLEA